MPNNSYDAAEINKNISALQHFFERKKVSLTAIALNQRTELDTLETAKEKESSSFFLLNHSTYQNLKSLNYELSPLLQSTQDGENEFNYYLYTEKVNKNSITSLPVYMAEPLSQKYFSFLFAGSALEKNHGRFEFIAHPLNLLKLMEARDHRMDHAHYSPLVLLSETENKIFQKQHSPINTVLVVESKNIPTPALFVRNKKNDISSKKFSHLMIKFQKTKEGKAFLEAFKISPFGKKLSNTYKEK